MPHSVQMKLANKVYRAKIIKYCLYSLLCVYRCSRVVVYKVLLYTCTNIVYYVYTRTNIYSHIHFQVLLLH